MRLQNLFYRRAMLEILSVCPEVTLGQPKVIEYLMENPRARQRDIATACVIEPPSLTSILCRMENVGLVARIRETGNLRAVLVSLTPKGRIIGQKMHFAFEKADQTALFSFSEEDSALLLSLMKRVEGNLERLPKLPRSSN